jgi:hypothetical protein
MIHADIVLEQTGDNVLTREYVKIDLAVAARLAPVLLRCKMAIAPPPCAGEGLERGGLAKEA